MLLKDSVVKKEILYLGNIYSKRDWGHAKDYVEAMWKILQQKKADDFVIATNNTYTVKQLVNEAFKNINIKIKWTGKGINEKGIDNKTGEILIKIDKRYFRPNELNYLRGDYNKKAKKLLKWKPKISFKNLVKEMVQEDIKTLKMEVDYFFLNLLLISTLFILSKPISNIVKISDFPEKGKSQNNLYHS